ncbi:hypothetical protein QQP08_008528 [Theobroma cacao]|nr:hypothetical protein QQP08_008528 [Theobroma cacao]
MAAVLASRLLSLTMWIGCSSFNNTRPRTPSQTALPYSIQEHQSYPKRSAQPHDPNNQIATYHSYQERKKARDVVRDQRKLSRQHGLT